MWPADPKIGPQLTYGVFGNGVALLNDNASLKVLDFPRLRDHGPRLHLIANSSRVLAEPQPASCENDDISVYNAAHRPLGEVGASDDVLVGLALEAEPFRKKVGQDPTIGTLVGEILLGTGAYAEPVVVNGKKLRPKAKNNVVDVKALVHGTSEGAVKVAPLIPKKKNLLHLEDPDLLTKRIVDTLNEDLLATYQVLWPILQIATCSESRLIAVRGQTRCCFLYVEWNNDPGQKGVQLKFAFEILNEGAGWADLIFSSWRFAMADISGKISIYDFDCVGGNWKYEHTRQIDPTLYDPLDWSHWLRIIWPTDSTYMLLFRRRAAYYVSSEKTADGESTATKLVSTHSWSYFQDVAMVGSNIFLLTSKELIWLQSTEREPMKRLLSWKHFLDDADPSTRLNVSPLGANTFALSVYTKEVPFVVTYTFGFVDEKPCSVYDPYVLYTSQGEGIAHFALLESTIGGGNEGPFANGFEITTDSGVNFVSFCGSEKRGFRLVVSTVEASSPAAPTSTKPAAWPKVFTEKELARIYSLFFGRTDRDQSESQRSTDTAERQKSDSNNVGVVIPDSQVEAPSSEEALPQNKSINEQIDVVQNFAFELGSELKSVLDIDLEDLDYPQYHTLASVAERIPMDVTDLREFDSMLQQLSEYCEDQGGRLDFSSTGLLVPESELSPTSLSCEYLASVMKDSNTESRWRAAVILVLCLVKAQTMKIESQHEQLIEEELRGCSEDLKEIFDEWQVHSSPEQMSISQAEMTSTPLATQNSQLPVKSQKSAKKGLLHQALTQNSQALKLKSSSLPSVEKDKAPDNRESSQNSEILFLSQFDSSQESLGGSQPMSSQNSSQSQTLAREGPKRKKKKKGGFA